LPLFICKLLKKQKGATAQGQDSLYFKLNKPALGLQSCPLSRAMEAQAPADS